MTLLRRVLRTLRLIVETLLAGALVGIVATVLATQLGGSSSGAPAEVPEAHAFMHALIRNDLDAMAQLGPQDDAISQGLSFQKRDDAVKNGTVDSLTYLGGAKVGGVGVHVYVVQTQDSTGVHLVPFSLTLLQSRVIRVE